MGCSLLKVNDVMKESWDYLIVLDACRYDYFKLEYEKFFHGELENRVSLGSATPEWCRKQFKKYFSDVVYVSGNPYINSKTAIAGFDAKKHFHKVIDVWDFGWSEELWNSVPYWAFSYSTVQVRFTSRGRGCNISSKESHFMLKGELLLET